MTEGTGSQPQIRPSTVGYTHHLELSPDGRFLLSTHSGDRVRVWDLAARAPVAQWVDPGDLVFGTEPATVLAADDAVLRRVDVRSHQDRTQPWPYPHGHFLPGPDATQWYLVTATGAARQLIDVATGAPRCTLSEPAGTIARGVLSPDGQWLATYTWHGGDYAVRIWRTADGAQVGELPQKSAVYQVAFLPGGQRCVVAADDTTRVWDLLSGTVVTGFDGVEFALSPDGTRLAVAGEESGTWIHSTADFEPLVELPDHGEIGALAFTVDGRFLATGRSDDSIIRVWDAATGDAAYELGGVTREVHALAFSPDGQRLASVVDDGHVRIWATDTGRLVHRLPAHTGAVQAVAYHPGGDLLAVADDETVRFWDAATGSPAGELPPTGAGTLAVAYAPDGGRLATAGDDGVLRIWDTGTREPVAELTGQEKPIWYVAFRPDGRHLVIADDEEVWAWDTVTGAVADPLAEASGWIDAVGVAPDGSGLAVGSCDDHDDATLEIYGAAGEFPAQPYTNRVWALAYTPGGALAVGGDDAQVRIFPDPLSEQDVVRLAGHTGLVRSLAVDAQGRLLAVGGTDGAVHLWDVEQRQRLAVLVVLDDGGAATLRDLDQHVVGGTPHGEFWYPRPAL
ncbi:WD40 repeat protein [Krasilnikovia cinnamomea]|uniref:WD40 repeat protein n=1 Tax=Krasilnikovia cinnamomea TaxID=349313 RepID=A0A4Q7ZTR6_9ACTN|nr:WD40 repeat domain-containing protein [Krasilnikovia cinnamomea]RZU53939.1 WD40 repeat protein [Krasilnikovia cinnamomea]